MASNYPPGVSGNEYEIAGPDYEKEIEDPCPNCHTINCLIEQGYRGNRWLICNACEHQFDLVDLEPLENSRWDADERV